MKKQQFQIVLERLEQLKEDMDAFMFRPPVEMWKASNLPEQD